MTISKSFSLAFLFFISLSSILHSCQAQNSARDYLDAHNAARARVGVGRMVWSDAVATRARNYVNRMVASCNLTPSPNSPYGENLARGSGDFTGRDAVGQWVRERPNYNYGSNSCVGGECRHYTQVVWRASVRLGCYRARCNNGRWYVACYYDPRGNVPGRRPY